MIDQILSHPNNLELNREIGKEILEAVKDDPVLTTEDKLILKEQVRIIIYGGSGNAQQAAIDGEYDPAEDAEDGE